MTEMTDVGRTQSPSSHCWSCRIHGYHPSAWRNACRGQRQHHSSKCSPEGDKGRSIKLPMEIVRLPDASLKSVSLTLLSSSYGYPALSSFMSSSHDTFIVRRFGALGARVVLLLQYKISRLEAQLHHEDQICRLSSGIAEADNGTFEGDPSQKRIKLMEEITDALERYREMHPCPSSNTGLMSLLLTRNRKVSP